MLTIQENNRNLKLIIKNFFHDDLNNLSMEQLNALNNSYSLINSNLLTTPYGALRTVESDVMNLRIKALTLRQSIMDLKPVTSGQQLDKKTYRAKDIELVKLLKSLKSKIALENTAKSYYQKYGSSFLVSFNKINGKILPITADNLKSVLFTMCKNKLNAEFKQVLARKPQNNKQNQQTIPNSNSDGNIPEDNSTSTSSSSQLASDLDSQSSSSINNKNNK